MPSLDDVDRLVDQEPKERWVKSTIYVSPRMMRRWQQVMPPNSLSWFVRAAIDAFLDGMTEPPHEAAERAGKLLAHDLRMKRTGPILRRHPRE